MQRIRLAASALTVSLLALDVQALWAQTLPTKKETEVILQNAAEAADLWARDTPPFHLLASVHYELGSQRSDGTYDLLWVSPDQYREYFTMATSQEVQIASGDKLYILRNTVTPSFALWSTRGTLQLVKSFFFGRKVKKMHPAQVAGLQASCVDSEDDFAQRQDCFDPITNQAVSVSFRAKPPHGLSIITEELKHLHDVELSSFVSLGRKHYPLQIINDVADQKLALKITTLEEPKSILQEWFAPPAGAQAFEWCPEPATSGPLQFSSGMLGQMEPPGGIFPYYVLVGRDGRAQKSAPMRSAGPRIDGQMATRLRMARFPIKSCRGNPIEYERVMIAPVGIHLPHY